MSALGIRRPGIYMIPPHKYHSDPVIRPSLSHSVARILLDRSPMHAKAAHPRLNPDFEPTEQTGAMIQGTVLHKLILGRGDWVKVIDAPDYRTNAAKDARDSAIKRGITPILRDAYSDMEKAAKAIVSQLCDDPEAHTFFAPGRSEAIAIGRIGPVWLRSMLDRLPNQEGAPLWDIKSTDKSARPADWERSLTKTYATQAAFHRLVAGLALKRPVGEMRFIVFERKPPYALSIVACGDTLIEAAEAEIRRGIEIWTRCIIDGKWPGYGKGVHRIEAPLHMLARAEEAKLKWSATE